MHDLTVQLNGKVKRKAYTSARKNFQKVQLIGKRKGMNGQDNIQATPNTSAITKKRELSSPEFTSDSKKNKPSSTSSESELETSDLTDSVTTQHSSVEMATSGTSEASQLAPHITIPSSEMAKISDMLKETFRGEIVTMVDVVVQGVLRGLNDRLSALEEKNTSLESENKALLTRVSTLEKAAEQTEQYSRRNNLRITGCGETDNENTDDIILKMAADIGSDIQLGDIDRSHRVGKPGSHRTRPREVIVKFTSYRARQKLYKMRTALKDSGYAGIFLNEDLTKYRSQLLYEARKIVKSENAKGAWSSDGNILIKDYDDTVHRINSLNDLTGIDFPPKPPEPMAPVP